MIAVDTNILVYAHREDSPHHDRALDALRSLVESGRSWAIPWPCVHEFLSVTTHRRIFDPPSSATEALEAISDLVDLPQTVLLGEGSDHLARLAALMTHAGVVGPKIHDARVAAICLAHGVSELWSADRDFSYFPDLVTTNPLV